MKIKNILIALSALFTLAACSSDNENGGKDKKAKAHLSVKVSTKVITKAVDTNELPGEALIDNLTALVFDETGSTLLGIKQETPHVEYEHTLSNIPSSEAGKVKIVLIANAPQTELNKVTSYTELEALLAKLSVQKQDFLTMSTPVISGTLNEGDNNYIGFNSSEYTNINGINTLYLTRVPARLQVGSVRTNFTKAVLADRYVRIQEVYYENCKTESRYFSVADWGKVEYGSDFQSSYMSNPNNIISNELSINKLGYYTYTMENFDNSTPTTLVVKATLNATEEYAAETRYFRAVINTDGRGVDHKLVKRNYVYNASLTFTDTSFDGDRPHPDPEPEPEESYFDVKVEVVTWGQVKQIVDVDK